MLDLYLWVKTAHVVSMVAWMAGIFYLPRLFVYHAEATPGSETVQTLKVMERRLLKLIMTPSMIATWVFGLWLIALEPGWLSGQGWLHLKIVLVLLMSGFHGACAKWRKELLVDSTRRSSRFFRIANEMPTLLLLTIIALVIVKPF